MKYTSQCIPLPCVFGGLLGRNFATCQQEAGHSVQSAGVLSSSPQRPSMCHLGKCEGNQFVFSSQVHPICHWPTAADPCSVPGCRGGQLPTVHPAGTQWAVPNGSLQGSVTVDHCSGPHRSGPPHWSTVVGQCGGPPQPMNRNGLFVDRIRLPFEQQQ